jgi:hypothetical protein
MTVASVSIIAGPISRPVQGTQFGAEAFLAVTSTPDVK